MQNVGGCEKRSGWKSKWLTTILYQREVKNAKKSCK